MGKAAGPLLKTTGDQKKKRQVKKDKSVNFGKRGSGGPKAEKRATGRGRPRDDGTSFARAREKKTALP